MFFMNNGRVYVEKAYDIPEGSRISKGRNIINFLDMQKDEKYVRLFRLTVSNPKNRSSFVLKKVSLKNKNQCIQPQKGWDNWNKYR